MSERLPPSRSARHGNRGRHRHATSPETKAWKRLAQEASWLQPESDDDVGGRAEPSQPRRSAPAVSDSLPAPPECPPWLDPGEYEALLELRQALESSENAA